MRTKPFSRYAAHFVESHEGQFLAGPSDEGPYGLHKSMAYRSGKARNIKSTLVLSLLYSWDIWVLSKVGVYFHPSAAISLYV